MRSPAIFLVTFSLGLFGLASAQGTLWVVDDDGGVGVDFLDVQPAVDAAGSGDTIEVRSGPSRTCPPASRPSTPTCTCSTAPFSALMAGARRER